MSRDSQHTHLSIVASHEESRAWHDEAIRVLAARARDDYEACDTGPCEGGTKLCPSPDACRRHEQKVARLYALRASADLPWAWIVRVVAICVVGYAMYRALR